jgi:hypothetical protein
MDDGSLPLHEPAMSSGVSAGWDVDGEVRWLALAVLAGVAAGPPTAGCGVTVTVLVIVTVLTVVLAPWKAYPPANAPATTMNAPTPTAAEASDLFICRPLDR